LNRWLAAAGFHGAMAVTLGAWAAHGAEATLPAHAVEWIRTGSAYQLWHALAVLGVAALTQQRAPQSVRLVTISGLAFALGALLFSGSLYLLAWATLSNAAWSHYLVYLTPLGGGLLILGWLLLIIAGWRARETR
jgi:uncharacterized membrane protein YgdD (TMEM256/DUF423 family)